MHCFPFIFYGVKAACTRHLWILCSGHNYAVSIEEQDVYIVIKKEPTGSKKWKNEKIKKAPRSCSGFRGLRCLKQTTNALNFRLRTVCRWWRAFCCWVHNRPDMHVVQCVHGNQVSTPLINTISTAACYGVHLSKPLDSQTNWLSSAVTWRSAIPVTPPPRPCTLFVYILRLYWESSPSTSISIAEMEFDRLLGSRHSTCQHVLLHLSLPLRLMPSTDLWGNSNKTQTTCKLHSRTRAHAPTSYNVLKFREGKQSSWEAGGSFSNTILSWMSIHFKERNKKTLGYVSQRLYTKALAPLSTYFQRAGDTLAVISVWQGPLSWQLFSREV